MNENKFNLCIFQVYLLSRKRLKNTSRDKKKFVFQVIDTRLLHLTLQIVININKPLNYY